MASEEKIIRQNVLARACELYIAGKLTSQDEILKLSERFEDWVHAAIPQEVIKSSGPDAQTECFDCKQNIKSQKVVDFSFQKWKVPICMKCQDKRKE